jgi:Tfp pilus assembly protein PilF
LAVLAVWIGWRVVWPAASLREVQQALDRENLAAARAGLDRHLARWPGDGRALLLAARAARRSDACADAERFLVAFEQAHEQTDASRLEWALLGVQQGDFGRDEERLRSYVERNHPDTTEILEALAKGYAVTYRRPEALLALGRLLDGSPGHVDALLLRGKVFESLRKTDEAEADFRQAVDRAPGNPLAHAALAGLLNRRGYTREAIYHFTWAQRSRAGDPATLLGLARAYADAAQLDEADRQLDALLAAEPDRADALVERGQLALRRERFAEAEAFLARAVRAAPWHRDGHRLRLIALKELGRSEVVLSCEARLAELEAEDGVGGRLKLRARDAPADTGVRWELWLWAQRNGEGEEGYAWLTEILRVDPKDARAQAALADYFERAGQPRRAALHREAAAKS